MANASANPGIISRLLGAPFTILQEPLATGVLLYILTRNPKNARTELSTRTGLSIDTLKDFITPLKWFLGLGVARRVHQSLDWFSNNNWHVSRTGEPWRFGDEKLTELVVITGGCSGFGRLMAKGFVGQARVVVLDIADLPAEMEGCKYHRTPSGTTHADERSVSNVHYYKCDITDPKAVSSVAASIREQHGDPSVLINNAGIGEATLHPTSLPQLTQNHSTRHHSPPSLKRIHRKDLQSQHHLALLPHQRIPPRHASSPQGPYRHHRQHRQLCRHPQHASLLLYQDCC